jgi:hypothetical protein
MLRIRVLLVSFISFGRMVLQVLQAAVEMWQTDGQTDPSHKTFSAYKKTQTGFKKIKPVFFCFYSALYGFNHRISWIGDFKGQLNYSIGFKLQADASTCLVTMERGTVFLPMNLALTARATTPCSCATWGCAHLLSLLARTAPLRKRRTNAALWLPALKVLHSFHITS